MSDILDLIDGAIDAHELSADAMRWAPDPVGDDEIPTAMTSARIAEIFDVPPDLLTSQVTMRYTARHAGWYHISAGFSTARRNQP